MHTRTWVTGLIAIAAAGAVAGGGVLAKGRAVAPTHSQVLKIMAQASEMAAKAGNASPTGEHLHQDGKAVVVPDGHGGWLTAIPAVRWPTADGYGQYVLFWHNDTFIGSNTLASLPSLGKETVSLAIVGHGPNRVTIKYAVYKPTDPTYRPSLKPREIRYRWNGQRLEASAPMPEGALESALAMELKAK